MPNKTFSIYSSKEHLQGEAGSQLLVEVGRQHLALLLLQQNLKIVEAFELFNFGADELRDFALLFASISKSSVLLGKSYYKAEVFFNNEVSLLVPIFKFNKEIAADYLNVVFGEDPTSQILFEHLPLESGMMNTFRVDTACHQVLTTALPNATFRHSWSKIIRLLEARSTTSAAELITVFFYEKRMTVVVSKDQKLHLIQSLIYATAEDVTYHLLNIKERLQLGAGLTIQVSGIINKDEDIYRQLTEYFEHVTIANADTTNVALDISQHPSHYFTPFFNLAL
ncbi:MAG TPA: DUF3822 family protein [Segetibacter sp.]|jgi:hypothetical protein